MYQEIQDFYQHYGTENKVENHGEMNPGDLEPSLRLYPTQPSSGAVRNLTPYFDREEPELSLPTLEQEFIPEFPGDILTSLQTEASQPQIFPDCLELSSDLTFPDWMENTFANIVVQY